VKRFWLPAVIVAGLLAAGIVWFARGGTPAYADPHVHGAITLYDAAGNAVTSGDIHARPFVARAVASVRGPAPYDVPGGRATLFAYQPREGVGAEAWSGDKLTASTPYGDVDHPTVTLVATDLSLADFLDEFPARWDGRVQLRLYLGAPGAGTLNTTYAALDLTVRGDTWTVAR
jgi:hypothetical protein